MRKLSSVLIFILITSCSKNGTDSGNPIVTLSIESYSTAGVSKVGTLAVAGTTFCFKRLRFKTAEDSTTTDFENDNDNIDLSLGSVAIDPMGTNLSQVNVPVGTYTRIEFDLESNCDGTNTSSVIVDNSNDGGTPFQTNDRITIKFEGNVDVSANMSLPLQLSTILTALDNVTSNNEIKTRLEDVGSSGSF